MMSSHTAVIGRIVTLAVLIGLNVQPSHAANRGGQGTEEVEPEFARLEKLVGRWKVTESHFDSKGEKVAIVKGTEIIEWILDHHAIRREYNSGPDAAMFRAFGILTWNAATDAYEGVWFDNRSTNGPTRTRGQWSDGDNTLTFTVESLDSNGSPLRFELVERYIEDTQRIATTYSLEGDKRIKRLEVNYERGPACPGRIRMVDELHGLSKPVKKKD